MGTSPFSTGRDVPKAMAEIDPPQAHSTFDLAGVSAALKGSLPFAVNATTGGRGTSRHGHGKLTDALPSASAIDSTMPWTASSGTPARMRGKSLMQSISEGAARSFVAASVAAAACGGSGFRGVLAV